MYSGRWAFGLTVTAFVWTLGLIAWALVAPAYSGVASDSSGVTHSLPSQTLVQENGASVLIPVAAPAVLVAVVWWALHRKCSRGSLFGERLAIALVILLGLFALVTGFSIGLYVLPVAVLLTSAVVMTPAGSSPAARATGRPTPPA